MTVFETVQKEEEYKILIPLFLISNPWLVALIYIIPQIPLGRRGHSSWGISLRCSPLHWLRIKVTFLFPLNSLYFFLQLQWAEESKILVASPVVLCSEGSDSGWHCWEFQVGETPEWTTGFLKTPFPGRESDPHQNRTDGGQFSCRLVTMLYGHCSSHSSFKAKAQKEGREGHLSGLQVLWDFISPSE